MLLSPGTYHRQRPRILICAVQLRQPRFAFHKRRVHELHLYPCQSFSALPEDIRASEGQTGTMLLFLRPKSSQSTSCVQPPLKCNKSARDKAINDTSVGRQQGFSAGREIIHYLWSTGTTCIHTVRESSLADFSDEAKNGLQQWMDWFLALTNAFGQAMSSMPLKFGQPTNQLAYDFSQTSRPVPQDFGQVMSSMPPNCGQITNEVGQMTGHDL